MRRRNVIKVAIAYLAGAWLIVQIVETVLPAFDWSGQVLRVVIIVLAIGFLPAMILAWVFEWTPEGLKRESDIPVHSPRGKTRSFDRFITVVLVVAVAYFGIDKFVIDPARDAAREREIADRVRGETIVDSYGNRSIVVLPFVNMSDSDQNDYFSDGLTEELLNLLAIDSIGNKNYFDLGFGYDFNESIQARFKINNLLDEDPPFTAHFSAHFNTDPALYDVFGRSFSLNLTMAFWIGN